MKEKRKHTRVPIESVTVEVVDHRGEPGLLEIGSIMNLSESGMLFESTESYPRGVQLRLTFVLPDSMVVIRTAAEVVHSFSESDSIYSGVTFLRLKETEKNIIRHYIQKSLQNVESRKSPRLGG